MCAFSDLLPETLFFFIWLNNYLRCDEWIAADIQNLQILAEFDVFWYFTDI